MAASAQFRRLVARIKELKDTFLPAIDPTGTYSRSDYDRVRAFRLLTHAEIEAYLEDVCVSAASQVAAAWQADSTARSTLLALLAFSDGVAKVPPDVMPTGQSLIRSRVEGAKDQYTKYAKTENMGVKEKQLLRLMLPLGIREHEIGATLAADLNTFGTQRGDHAHQSIAAQVPPDPGDTLVLVARIVWGLRRLDIRVQALGAE